MLEILQNFESTVGEAARLRPLVLIGLGAAAVGVGLFVWLGGLSLRKLWVAIAGAVAGGILGFVLIGNGVAPTAASAVVAAVIARVFERVFITVLAAALAGAIGFAVLAGPYIESPQAVSAANHDGASARTTTGRDAAGMEELKAYALDVGGSIKRAAWQMPVQKWAIIALLAVIVLVGGFALWRPTAALCFSVLGTILISVGMILLLLYKGAGPVSRISSRPLIYAGVFTAMALFGTVEQLLLCRGAKKQGTRPRKAGGQKETTQEKHRSWRTG
ncbi:MAG TPA: hypothetical protein VMW24_06320 [Sedimentisphaerales bacterium]|nr:hypothetical protein [Sedimentisphaerales bacterium]